MCTPVNPSFTIKKWDLKEGGGRSKLYRYVFVMDISYKGKLRLYHLQISCHSGELRCIVCGLGCWAGSGGI